MSGSSTSLKLNKYHSELNYRLKRYKVISKYISINDRIENLNEIYEIMNNHFMDIHSYLELKNNNYYRNFFIITIKKAKKLLEEIDDSIYMKISDELKFKFKNNLKEYIEKRDLYIRIKLTLIPRFKNDLTESILDFL